MTDHLPTVIQPTSLAIPAVVVADTATLRDLFETVRARCRGGSLR